jgi:hypothetical protein
MQPGLRRLVAERTHLTPSAVPGRGVARHLREKLAVLRCFADQALCASPGFDAEPALAALAQQAQAEHPQAFVLRDGLWQAPGLGWALDASARVHEQHTGWPEVGVLLQALPAGWRHAALLALAFEEDFAVVDATTGTIPWLAVTFPSAWAPEDKVGRSFAAVHAPVADNRMLVQAAEGLLALVTGGDRWERFVWTLTPHPRLHAHPQRLPDDGWPQGLQGDALANQTWLRTERQTFMPVPGAAQAVFTIHVQTQPLPQALAGPERVMRLHDALASMSAAVLAYRGLTQAQGPLLAWLKQRATQMA